MEAEWALYYFLYYETRLYSLKILLSDQARIAE